MSTEQHETHAAKPLEAATASADAPAPTPAISMPKTAEEKPVSPLKAEARLGSPAGIPPSSGRKPYAQAAALALAVGLGWLGGWTTFAASNPFAEPAQETIRSVDWAEVAAGVRKAGADADRAAAEVRTLKAGLDGLKDSVERSKQDGAARLAQVGERLDRAQQDAASKLAQLVERLQGLEQQSVAKLADIAKRLDKAEPSGHDARLAQIAERLERMERQMAAANAAVKPTPASADHPSQTGAIPETKSTKIEGWVLREVYDGVALVEGRNGRLVEIMPGRNLPGVGRVEAIERRGKSWVVVTSRGLITSQQW